MIVKNKAQLKDWIKKLSKEKNIIENILLQNYMLERLLERISVSKYKEQFILKGRNANKCFSWSRYESNYGHGCYDKRISFEARKIRRNSK